jgi:hypothetical protein
MHVLLNVGGWSFIFGWMEFYFWVDGEFYFFADGAPISASSAFARAVAGDALAPVACAAASLVAAKMLGSIMGIRDVALAAVAVAAESLGRPRGEGAASRGGPAVRGRLFFFFFFFFSFKKIFFPR